MASRRIQTFCNAPTVSSHLSVSKHWRGTGEFFTPKISICGKVRGIVQTEDYGDGYVLQTLQCGHTEIEKKETAILHEKRNLKWERLLPFQRDFIEKAERNNCRMLLGDEMGTGKTVQVLSLLNENAPLFTENYTKYCVVVVLPGAVFQWNEECDNWLSYTDPTSFEDIYMMPQVIWGAGQKLSEAGCLVIIPWSRLGDKVIFNQLKKKGVASVIVDECHFFKNESSARTKNLLELIKLAPVHSPRVFMSGTLVENRVIELRVPLNILDPNYFYSWRVIDRFCIHDSQGKAQTLNPWMRDRFFERINPYSMARKKADLDIPLPLNYVGEKAPEYHALTFDVTQYKANEEFARAYNRTVDELEELLQAPSLSSATIIGLMQQLRHQVGKMKILNAAVWVENWMLENPGEKLCIGIHHKAVRETLAELLKHHAPLQMSDESPKVKDETEKAFKSGKSRLLIASVLSAGTGRNFQFCRNALILERQWNRSREDQFAQRFHRIIKDDKGRIKTEFGIEDVVHIYVANAANTFDEYFDSMIHLKGVICDSTDESIDSDELPPVDAIVEMAWKVVQNRMKFLGV